MNKLLTFSIIFTLVAAHTIFGHAPSAHAKKGNWQEGARLSVRAVIEPFTYIKLSANSIVFNVTGEPGEYPADKSVKVTVGSNSNTWVVKTLATPLVGENGEIPAKRILLKKKSGKKKDRIGAYTDMGKEILLAEGTNTAPTTAADIKFKLKTTWEDKAGTYNGEIMFIYLAMP